VQRRFNIKSKALIGLSDAAITMYLAGIDADEDEEIWNIKEKCKPDFTTLSAHRALQFSPFYCALATVIQGHVATPGDVTAEAQTLAPATRSRLPTGAYNTNQAFEEMGLSRLYITKKSPGAAENMESMRRRNSASCSDGSHAGDEGADKSASGKTGRNTVALARDKSDEDDSRTTSGESHSSNTTGGTNGSDPDYSSQSRGSTDSSLNQHREVCEEATVRLLSTFIFCVVGSLHLCDYASDRITLGSAVFLSGQAGRKAARPGPAFI